MECQSWARLAWKFVVDGNSLSSIGKVGSEPVERGTRNSIEVLKTLTENVVIYGVERSRQIKKSYDIYIAIVRSMQNVIYHIEQGSFRTVPWPICWLGSRAEVVSVEVCWELWEDDIFSDFWPKKKKKKKKKRKTGDGPVVFQTGRVKKLLFQKLLSVCVCVKCVFLACHRPAAFSFLLFLLLLIENGVEIFPVIASDQYAEKSFVIQHRAPKSIAEQD